MLHRHQITLPCGLTLVTIEQPHLHAVAVSYVVRCGSRHEALRDWGLSHFLEHMVFRGSARYPSVGALIAPFERAGGTLSAETWRDHTHFSTVIHPTKLQPTLDALGDMMARPAFLDLEAERALVEAELGADLDEAGEDVDLCNASRAAVWPNHALGRRITGSTKSVARFGIEDLHRYHRRFYGGKNAVLVVAGRIDAETVAKHVAQAFSHLPRGTRARRSTSPGFSPERIFDTVQSPSSQVSVALTFPALPEGHKQFYALELMAAILDDGMGSRLHRALSERTGLVYAYDSGLDCYSDAGLYEIEMQVAPNRVLAALQSALAELDSMAAHGISQTELNEAQERALMAIELGQDSVEDVAHEAAVDVLFKRDRAATYACRLRQVTTADVQQLARYMFWSGQVHALIMGPLQRISINSIDALLRPFSVAKRSPQSVTRGRRRRLPKAVAYRDSGHNGSAKCPVVVAPTHVT